MGKYWEMEKPVDATQAKAEDAYYDMFGFWNSTLYPDGKGFVRTQSES